ncbi:HEAT repeat domain-containing protein [Leptospira gomenensis]|uniref:HEAT repeat domain-containing protein n=1 Tax=Leptospira gomenensis TaxID=2484974 RepID=A0A5F1Z1C4_9LEPT|nr:HEAT repeat domain-containing protein [Leptospira gomenensis]TGK33399.1 HEAT repeat domain-containing protein [Leptospira gomenensis]TGK44040.1 HEAT repeat domain-containing protein [Leptospira gomenensis]TGK46409.1 HEAT repeat domain-containing protein [Leptospira gomenensis]TGK67455.1 HEAT repeat domain-containing protein [Leptospira gomenensis]
MFSDSKLQNTIFALILFLMIDSTLVADSNRLNRGEIDLPLTVDAPEDGTGDSDNTNNSDGSASSGLNVDDPRNLSEESDGVSSYEKRKRKNLTPKERQEIDYDLSLKKGILTVFRAETEKRYKTLDRIALTHPIPRVRAAAVLALGRMGKSGVKTLHRVIERDGEAVKQAAYRALADIGSPFSLDYFFRGIKSNDPDIQFSSWKGMGKTNDPSARDALLRQGIRSTRIEIVKASLLGLAAYQVNEDLKLFKTYLDSEDPDLQKTAIEALGIHKTRASLRILEQTLETKPELTRNIIEAIGQNTSLYGTYSFIRILESSPSEELAQRVLAQLYIRKAFYQFGTVNVEGGFSQENPYPTSRKIRNLSSGEVGKILKKSDRRFIQKIGDKYAEDHYYLLLLESKNPESYYETHQSWVFGSFLKLRTIVAPPKEKTKKGKREKLRKKPNGFTPASDMEETDPANPGSGETPNENGPPLEN